jgi:hypothetical protein|tara:strand:- start:225 stop:656 length:432 start_codon:yes stop_codon:yes gene_type:complete
MGTGLGRTILGPEENIRNLTKGDLESYINTHYTADRFVIAAAGAVDHNQLVDLTEKHFGGLPQGPKNAVSTQFDPAIFTGSDKRIRFDSMGVRSFCFSCFLLLPLYLHLINLIVGFLSMTVLRIITNHRPVLTFSELSIPFYS